MSVTALLKAVVEARPKAIHVGAGLFQAIYDEMKQAEQRTGKWMRWSEPTINAPNLMFMGIPAVVDTELAPDAFSLKE